MQGTAIKTKVRDYPRNLVEFDDQFYSEEAIGEFEKCRFFMGTTLALRVLSKICHWGK
jgi:hypothetical protein